MSDTKSTSPDDVLKYLSVEDLLKLRELLSSGIHDLSQTQVNTLRSLIELYTEYNTELKIIVEEKKIRMMWSKIRLQMMLTAKYVLYFVLAIFAAVQTVDSAFGIIKKWWAQ